MHSHQRLTQPDFSPGWVTSLPPQRIQASPQTEPTRETAERDLRAERERAERLGHKFDQISILSPERSEPHLSPRIQPPAPIQRQQGPIGALTDSSEQATDFYAQQVLAGEQRGGLAGLSQQAMGYAGGFFSSLSTEKNLPKTALTLAGGATVGAFLPGAAATTGLGAGSAAGVGGGTTGAGGATLANSSVLYSGGQAALTQQLPQWVIPGTVTAGAGAAWMSSPWSPLQQGMMPYVNTGRPEELGDPSGVREDLIPMTGDLPGQVEGIPMEQPGAQVLGEDPVQVPGAHDPLTTPMEGPQLPQVESFPDAELNQPGEAAPASSKEQGALEKAMQAANWERVKDYLGKRLDEVGVPPGYFARPKDNPEELVRSAQDDSVQVPLQVINGVISVRLRSSNRISNPTEMDRNFTNAYGQIAKGYEKHHLNPDNQVQDLELLQFAHEQGWYNLDRASNLLGMPGKEKWEKIQSGEEQLVTGPGYTNTMGHWSSHNNYDENVVTREINRRFELILDHFGVGKLSEVPQERMDELKDMVMNNITEAEKEFRQLIHGGDEQVETKDGRISWGPMDESETA